jgi:hypothetical protein
MFCRIVDDWIYFLHVYKHPKMASGSFAQELCAFLTRHVPGLERETSGSHEGAFKWNGRKFIFVGDFNMNMNKRKEDPWIVRLMNMLRAKVTYDTTVYPYTTLNMTRIDWSLYTMLDERLRPQESGGIESEQLESHVYACYYGIHMPIYISYRSMLALNFDNRALQAERTQQVRARQFLAQHNQEVEERSQVQRTLQDISIGEEYDCEEEFN